MKTLITGMLAALTLVVATSTVSAADSDANATARTVWVDGKGQKSMADKANKMHAEMAAQGWRFEGMDVYTEDGDMKGLFITYVRDRAPAPQP